jgi:N12 class adenine-specific DNA methylase
MQGVADMGDKSGSQRALDLYMKVRYLQRLNADAALSCHRDACYEQRR